MFDWVFRIIADPHDPVIYIKGQGWGFYSPDKESWSGPYENRKDAIKWFNTYIAAASEGWLDEAFEVYLEEFRPISKIKK